jgi:hypothetical protein
MIDTPHIVRASVVQAAVIHLTIPRAGIQAVMGPGLGELMAVLGRQGNPPAGPWFAHHLRMDPATFDFEIGHLRLRDRRARTSTGGARGPGQAGPAPGCDGGSHGLPRALRGSRHGVAQARRLDRRAGAQARSFAVGGVPHGSAVEPGPHHLAHGARQAAGWVGGRRHLRRPRPHPNHPCRWPGSLEPPGR